MNIVVFADAHHDTCPPQMEALRKRLIEEHYDVRECFTNLALCSVFSGMRSMIKFMRLYAVSKTVVLCDNYLPVSSCRKRRRTTVIQLWHGCGAFKKFGYDAPDDIPAMYRGNVYKNYDLVTVSGECCIPHFESAMRIKSVVLPIGISYTDRLYDKAYIDMCRDRFRYEYPDAAGKKVVLWAPTFRGNAGLATAKALNQLGEEYIDVLAANDNLYLIKSLHPHLIRGESGGMTTGELMVCADILITDYSSVFFEYLIMDRPIIFFAPDYEEYSGSRGYYLNYCDLPGVVVTDGEDLLRTVMDVSFCDSQDMKEKRERFRRCYMSACDGNATERLMSYIKSKAGIEK